MNCDGINIIRAVFLQGKHVIIDRETAIMDYVTHSIDECYMSRQALRELGVISSDFPKH